jgi:hypothetical protein
MMLRLFCFLILAMVIADVSAFAQASTKKIRMGIQSTNIGFLPFTPPFIRDFTGIRGSTSK